MELSFHFTKNKMNAHSWPHQNVEALPFVRSNFRKRVLAVPLDLKQLFCSLSTSLGSAVEEFYAS
jgi:hypothetical protein